MSKAENQSTLKFLQNMNDVEKWIGFFLGPIILLLTLVLDPPGGMSVKAWHCMGMGSLMAIWWATEAIPIPATALLPIFLIPALGLGSVKAAAAPYANPTIYLFFGGFLLGLAMEKCNLHKRIALNILNAVGTSPSRQIAGFMIATAFISMWVSNTATAVMMTPIGLSVAAVISHGDRTAEHDRFEIALLLSIAYSASIGGIATLIGTPPNALLRAFLEEHYQIELGFAQWMLLGVPVAVIMLAFTFWWLTRKRFSFGNCSQSTADVIKTELDALGKITYAEKAVAIVFTIAALLWIFRPMLKGAVPFLNDTVIAMGASLVLFLIPTNVSKREFLMDWEQATKLPWGILILFGGGLALAGVINSSTLALWLAEQLNVFGGVNFIIMIGIVTTAIIFLTEITSNTATAAAFLPLVGAMAVAQGVEPQYYAVPAAIAASCAFMLPVATPPNAIVFGSGVMPISAMMRAGFALNVFGIIAVTLLSTGLAELIF